MSGRRFADTNVLVYAVSPAEGGKWAAANELLRSETVCISTQVLGEFYRATTSARRAAPLTHEEAAAWIGVWKLHEVQGITGRHVDLALEIAGRWRIGYYDALILAAARLAQCEVVLSEDMQDGQDYGGVRVENLFRGRGG